MFKPKSMFQKVIYKTLIIACIPLVIITILFCYFVYESNVEAAWNEAETLAQEYTQSIRQEIENTLQRSDYVLRTTGIVERLDTTYVKNTDRLLLSNYLSDYIGLFITGEGETNFVIYTSNSTIYEDRVVSYINRLEDYENIWASLEASPANLVWDTEIERGDHSFFTFYRKFMTEDRNILACKIRIPDAPKGSQFLICSRDEATPQGQYIEMPINEVFVLRMERDNQFAYNEVLKTILIFVAFMGFSLLIVFLLSKRITRSLTQGVDEFVRKLSHENLTEMDESDFYQETDLEEMQIIKKAILQLLSEIQSISLSKQRVELEKKDMELGLLQKQLDPHTLYNSLSAIKYNAFVRGDKDTIKIVAHMTDYYRAVLNKGKDFVLLSEELEAMHKYVTINELSRGISYELIMTAEPELAGCKIIHLLLLPFVENAIIHAFDGDEESRVIRINCKRDGAYIEIQIADNGFGISQDKVMLLNDLENYSESYGIINSYRRLRLAYGENSSLHFASKPGEGTVVTVRFIDGM